MDIEALAKPILDQVLASLAADQYYLIAYPDPSWLTVQVGSQAWLPAFRDPLDAQQVQPPGTELVLVPARELLWRGMGLKQTQGIIFYDRPGDRQWGKQVDCQRLKRAIQAHFWNTTA
ncbi:MAG: hypothetical protein Q6K99_00285 [Thermostichales cyanobacterium BF4_bins_65]